MVRGRLGTIALAVAAVLPAGIFPINPRPATAQAAPDPTVIIEGKGWGHGVGMAQDGARWMGAEGATTARILSAFYPGTTVGSRSGPVRVPVLLATSRSTVLAFPDGGEVRQRTASPQDPGFPLNVPPGGRVLITHDGLYGAELLGPAPAPAGPLVRPRFGLAAFSQAVDATTATTTSAPAATDTTVSSTTVARSPASPASTTARTLVPRTTARTLLPRAGAPRTTARTLVPRRPPSPSTPSRPAPPVPPRSAAAKTSTPALDAVASGGGAVTVETRNRRYRGRLEATLAPGGLRLVNEVDVEIYLRGMGEVRDPSWPPASLGAQAVAARTYALRAMAKVGEICDDDRCQVYLGAQVEYPEMNRAVADTAGQVLSFEGDLATAVYSANAGGYSATPQEGFGRGASARPYLLANRYSTRDPMAWKVQATLAEVGRRLGYPGRLDQVSVMHTGPSGRVLELTLDGEAGPRPVPGLTAANRLGLRSSLFTMADSRNPVGPGEGLGTEGDGGPGIDPGELGDLLDGSFGLDGGADGGFGRIDIEGIIQRLPDEVPRGFDGPADGTATLEQGQGPPVPAAPAADVFARWTWSATVQVLFLVALVVAVLERRTLVALLLRRRR